MLNQLNFEGKTKLQVTIERVQAFAPEDGYYVAISGGKDSDILPKLCQLANVKYDLHHQLTTADAPETVYYIRDKYPDCKIDYPKKNIWTLIVEQGVPPTRLMRYCCKYLKEYGGENRTKMLGIRAEESTKRKNNRRFTEMCYKNHTVTVNPILDWTEDEVWEFHNMFNLPHNPLYDMGVHRIGCIMCPQKGKKAMLEDAKRFPKYYHNYLRAFEKMLAVRRSKGLKTTWKTPEEVFEWWINL